MQENKKIHWLFQNSSEFSFGLIWIDY